MLENFIVVESFKKLKYENNTPTGKMYRNKSYVSLDSIVYITSAKTSIYKPEFNIDYYEEGSAIHLIDGTKLTCREEPKIIQGRVDQAKQLIRENN
jgi:hypothetical protein